MRILIWHGYLLGGTGSNVYTRALARAWSLAGHDVTVLCQEPRPERYDLGGARVVRVDIDGPLPVFVLDRYDHIATQRLGDLSVEQRQHFVDLNVAAVRAEGSADLLVVNHVLLGAPVGADSGLPFVVKAHGSELEFSMRGNDDLCKWATTTLAGSRAVIAGTHHIAGVLDELVDVDDDKVHVIPPGVDVEAFRPADRGIAMAGLIAECEADEPNMPHGADGHDERRPDPGNAEPLARFLAGEQPTVVYVGKLSEAKGVQLLIEAVAGIDARCVVVGFGPERQQFEAAAGDNVLFTGPLEHRHLVHLWPLAHVGVAPSVFPEAFGMVVAEAAACGSPPLVARHSGLAEIAAALEPEYPPQWRHLASFARGDASDLAAKLAELIALPANHWQELSVAARTVAVAQWSWSSIAIRILAAADIRA